MASPDATRPAEGKRVRRTRYACPECGKVSVFTTGQVIRCKGCGAYAPPEGEDAVAVPGAPTAPPPTGPLAPAPPPAPAARREPPVALAVASLVCGLAAAATFWVFPFALLLAVAAVALGGVALSRHEDDAGVQVMAVIGIIVGGLVLVFVLWLLSWYDGGSSDGGSSVTVENENNQGSGGGGGSSGGGGGSGGSSGGGGGSSGGGGGGGGSSGGGGGGSGGEGGGGGGVGVETGVGTDVDAPAPAGLLVGVGLLALAGWRRGR